MERWEDLLARLAEKNAIPFARRRLPVSRFFPTRDGSTLHYLDWGGPGQSIVFLHGGVLTARTWDLVCLALSDAFRCVAVDLRGHGLSDWSDGYSTAGWASDAASLVEHLDLDACHLVGMSLGGSVATHYAAAEPSPVKSLVVVDVAPGGNFGATAGMREFMSRPIAASSLDRLTDEALGISATADREKLLYRYAHMTRTRADGSFGWRHDDRRSFDLAGIFDKIQELAVIAPRMTCPALIVRGGRSRVLTEEAAERFAGLFRDGDWMVVPDAGHNVQEDNPKVLAEAIRAFVAVSSKPGFAVRPP